MSQNAHRLRHELAMVYLREPEVFRPGASRRFRELAPDSSFSFRVTRLRLFGNADESFREDAGD